jgi:hypothetical protein
VKSSLAFRVSPVSACPAAPGLQIGLRNRFSTCDFLHFPGRERTRSGLSVHTVNVGRLRVERAGIDGFTDDHCSLALRRCYLRMFLKPAASR